MRPLDFYDLGVRLAEEGRTEAEQWTAVSRIYYGLLHEAACRYFRENPDASPIPRNRRHSAVRDRLGNSGAPEGIDAANFLRRLAWMRGECDYQIGAELRYEQGTMALPAMVSLALEAAADCLAALDAYSPGESADGSEWRVSGG